MARLTPRRVRWAMRFASWLIKALGAEVVYIVAAKRVPETVEPEWIHQWNRNRTVTGFAKAFWHTVGDDAAQHYSEAEIFEMVGD